VRSLLIELGAEILPFDTRTFGESYPYGNKIECLAALPGRALRLLRHRHADPRRPDRGPFDFDRPSASLRVEGTWPQIELYGPGYTAIWKSLYDRFGIDFERSLDPRNPTNTGAVISISTPGSSITAARAPSDPDFWRSRAASATTRRPSLSVSRSTHGWTRSPCRW
jgi:hypothetical protein